MSENYQGTEAYLTSAMEGATLVDSSHIQPAPKPARRVVVRRAPLPPPSPSTTAQAPGTGKKKVVRVVKPAPPSPQTPASPTSKPVRKVVRKVQRPPGTPVTPASSAVSSSPVTPFPETPASPAVSTINGTPGAPVPSSPVASVSSASPAQTPKKKVIRRVVKQSPANKNQLVHQSSDPNSSQSHGAQGASSNIVRHSSSPLPEQQWEQPPPSLSQPLPQTPISHGHFEQVSSNSPQHQEAYYQNPSSPYSHPVQTNSPQNSYHQLTSSPLHVAASHPQQVHPQYQTQPVHQAHVQHQPQTYQVVQSPQPQAQTHVVQQAHTTQVQYVQEQPQQYVQVQQATTVVQEQPQVQQQYMIINGQQYLVQQEVQAHSQQQQQHVTVNGVTYATQPQEQVVHVQQQQQVVAHQQSGQYVVDATTGQQVYVQHAAQPAQQVEQQQEQQYMMVREDGTVVNASVETTTQEHLQEVPTDIPPVVVKNGDEQITIPNSRVANIFGGDASIFPVTALELDAIGEIRELSTVKVNAVPAVRITMLFQAGERLLELKLKINEIHLWREDARQKAENQNGASVAYAMITVGFSNMMTKTYKDHQKSVVHKCKVAILECIQQINEIRNKFTNVAKKAGVNWSEIEELEQIHLSAFTDGVQKSYLKGGL